ncbi:imidazole glycerol phosphate synthase subunit HisF [Halobacteriovorax marinus]|uniref:imidazole glycerol-phosphate synthase n=1 Tax=Halobacteriovorax marinus TaxID=97084 RepID=A0A1Y5FAW9_9BACT|nr:imidazole glycerol phosphate synthase subunit HisF [Halobacteriovorax marinus]
MRKIRLIARLDIKGPNLIKGINLEGVRVIGCPHNFAKDYYLQGADELIYMDAVASLYGRNSLGEIVENVTKDVFIPITVGGGIRSIEDVNHILRCGADKVAINTAAISRPELISEVAEKFGSQCMVLSVEAKFKEEGKWEAYVDNGREPTGLDVSEWVKKAVTLGAGEVMLTSIDKEGTKKGFDINLVKVISEVVNVPIIACGGMGKNIHLEDVVKIGGADAVAFASVLHYKKTTFPELREFAKNVNIEVRCNENK